MTRSGLSKDRLATILSDLHRRMESAEDRRAPGGVQPDGVYWNGFYWGIQVAIELLERKEGG